MQNPRFVVLTGHLNDYPLSDLVGILRYQRKTGRLLIEYPNGPAAFYFQEGELVDAQVDKLSGLQAVCVALAQPTSPFNFNPLVSPARRSIENSLQRVVSELLGCWDDSPLQIETAVSEKALPQPEPLAIPASTSGESEVKALDVLPLSSLKVPAASYSRTIVAMAAAGLMMLGISTVIAVTGGFKGGIESAKNRSLPPASISRSAPASGQKVPAVSLELDQKKNSDSSDFQRARGTSPATELTRFRVNPKERALSSERPSEETLSTLANDGASESSINDDVNNNSPSVDVVMQIENGRVLRASIANPRKGMDGYEALALRIARQRRYPGKKKGEETVKIRVSPPD